MPECVPPAAAPAPDSPYFPFPFSWFGLETAMFSHYSLCLTKPSGSHSSLISWQDSSKKTPLPTTPQTLSLLVPVLLARTHSLSYWRLILHFFHVTFLILDFFLNTIFSLVSIFSSFKTLVMCLHPLFWSLLFDNAFPTSFNRKAAFLDFPFLLFHLCRC